MLLQIYNDFLQFKSVERRRVVREIHTVWGCLEVIFLCGFNENICVSLMVH